MIKDSVSYNPETGKFLFKYNPHKPTGWNTRFAGKEAFTCVASNGYLMGRVDYTRYIAHRVAWLLHYGEWPNGHIDHINGDMIDNRICNLRDVTISQNMWNSKIGSNNTSGYKGVCWSKKEGKWVAHIQRFGKMKRLGCFTDKDAAYAAYCKASEEMHGEHGRVA